MVGMCRCHTNWRGRKWWFCQNCYNTVHCENVIYLKAFPFLNCLC
jgi:hypothetical protein